MELKEHDQGFYHPAPSFPDADQKNRPKNVLTAEVPAGGPAVVGIPLPDFSGRLKSVKTEKGVEIPLFEDREYPDEENPGQSKRVRHRMLHVEFGEHGPVLMRSRLSNDGFFQPGERYLIESDGDDENAENAENAETKKPKAVGRQVTNPSAAVFAAETKKPEAAKDPVVKTGNEPPAK